MEITIISAEGLAQKSPSLFSGRLRPFVALTVLSPSLLNNGDEACRMYQTTVADGGINPTWGDKFNLSVDSTFFYQKQFSIYLQLYTKLLMGRTVQLGWCHIPAGDILDPPPTGTVVRHLSYRLRKRDGSMGRGVINVAVKLEGSLPSSDPTHLPAMGSGGTVVGMPVGMLPAAGVCEGRWRGSRNDANMCRQVGMGDTWGMR
ncbi:hypothetical protein NMG60_11030420 [Bertholletia excelsa]